MWCEVLVPMECTLLQKASGPKVCVWGGRVVENISCLVLEAYRSWMNGKLLPKTLSAERTIHGVVAAYNREPKDGKKDGRMDPVEGHHYCPWQIELHQLQQQAHSLS